TDWAPERIALAPQRWIRGDGQGRDSEAQIPQRTRAQLDAFFVAHEPIPTRVHALELRVADAALHAQLTAFVELDEPHDDEQQRGEARVESAFGRRAKGIGEGPAAAERERDGPHQC